MKNIAFIVAVAFMASGCGKQGAGVSAESSSGSSVDTKNALSMTKEVSAGGSTKKTIAMPAVSLIADAMRDVVEVEGISAESVQSDFTNGASKRSPWSPLSSALGTSQDGLKPPAWWSEKLESWEKQDFKSKTASTELKKCGAMAAKQAKNPDAVSCLNNYFMAINSASSIVLANMPLNGWPLDPYKSKLTNPFLIAMSVNAEYASLLETEIAAQLQGRVLRDPKDAKEQIAAALFAIPKDKLEAFAVESNRIAVDALKARLSLDMASGKGVSWTADGIIYSNTGKGWTIVRNGMTWFGEGHASGKSYDLALESTVSATRSTRDQTDQSVGSSSQDTVKGSVGVK